MKWRIGFLFAVMGIRLLLNYFDLVGYAMNGVKRYVNIKGKAIILEQNRSECIYRVGKVWFREENKCKFSLQAEIEVVGKLDFRVIDAFLGRLWLVDSKIISYQIRESRPGLGETYLNILREKMVSISGKYLPANESALVVGIVLGYKESLSNAFYQALVNSGTVHIVVASGYNVMIVAGVAMAWLFWLVKRRWATVLGIVMIWFYVFLSGLSAPVVRAAIMATMVLWGQCLGRRQTSWWALLLTVWLMLLIEPLQIESISFQLSVAATMGVFFVSEKISKLSPVLEKTGLGETLGAMIVTGPVLWWHFGRVGLVAVLSNVLVLPLVPMVMFLGAMMMLLGLVWLPLAFVVSVPTYAVVHLLVVLVEFFGS